MARFKDRKLVAPGDRIGVIEEYEYGDGLYEHKGIIRSSLVGWLEVDAEKHFATVIPTRKPLLPRSGDIVYAIVSSTSNKMASVMIISIDNRLLNSYLTGLIHLKASSGRVKTIKELFKPGDIIRCEVLDFRNGVYHLTTKSFNLGVVYTVCSSCGASLVKTGKTLKCPACGNVEVRKTAQDYGNIRLR